MPSFPSPTPVAVGRAAAEVIRTGELSLPLTSCGTPGLGPCGSPGQPRRADSDGVGVAEPALRAQKQKNWPGPFAHCCKG